MCIRDSLQSLVGQLAVDFGEEFLQFWRGDRPLLPRLLHLVETFPEPALEGEAVGGLGDVLHEVLEALQPAVALLHPQAADTEGAQVELGAVEDDEAPVSSQGCRVLRPLVEVLGVLAPPDLLDLPDVDAAVEGVLAGERSLPDYQHRLPPHQHRLLLRLLVKTKFLYGRPSLQVS